MEPFNAFLFPKLKNDKYLILNILMYLDYKDALNFIFFINKDSRTFQLTNFITLKNEFINEGLIDYQFDD